MTSSSEFAYRMGDADAPRIRAALESILRDPATQIEADALGINADLSILGARARQRGAGLDPITLAIIITIAGNLGSSVIESLWTNVLYPRLLAQLGMNALGTPEQDSSGVDSDGDSEGDDSDPNHDDGDG